MTAHARPKAARDISKYWQRAVDIRHEWLDHGLATAPADRCAAETGITRIYAWHSRPRPRFVWVDSPRLALPLIAGLPTHAELHRWVAGRRPPGAPPLTSDIAAGRAGLQSVLNASVTPIDLGQPKLKRRKGERWPSLRPLEALEAGVPFLEVLRTGVREALFASLATGCYLPIRSALTGTGGPLPSAWYGQQDAHWIAYYDALRRLGFATYRAAHERQLDVWATLARTCGWWWPGEDTCVVVERPSVLQMEGVRMSKVEYRDGWNLLGQP